MMNLKLAFSASEIYFNVFLSSNTVILTFTYESQIYTLPSRLVTVDLECLKGDLYIIDSH